MYDKPSSDIELRYMDKAHEASVAFWNALLTVNGVIVSAFSILALVIKRFDFVLTIFVGYSLVSALISLWLLVMNFSAAKSMYERIGKVLSSNPDELTDNKRKADIDGVLKLRGKIQCRETTVKWLFGVQLIIFIAIFFRQQFVNP